MEMIKEVVKIKKLQLLGDNLAILIPKGWSDALDWNRTTKLVLEFLPHRQMMILSKKPVKTTFPEEYKKFVEAKQEADEIEAEADAAANEIMEIPEDEFHGKDPGDHPPDEENSDTIQI